MSRPRGGLGRGLASLIPTGPQTTVVTDYLMSGTPSRVAADKAGPTADAKERSRPEQAGTDDIRSSRSPAVSGDRDGHSDPNGYPDPNGHSDPNGYPDPNGNADVKGRSTTALPTDLATDLSTHRATDRPPRPDGPRYAEIPIDQIRRNPRNPRTVFDEEALEELAHSVREFGLLQPIVVRQGQGGYELVMGERRWRAAQRAGLTAIPAIIRRTEDVALLRDALLENIHRANLNPLEEAAAYQQLLEEFDVTQEELAARIGRSRPVISNTIRLLKLPVPVQRRVAAGVLSAGHARALLSLETAEDQEQLAARVVAEGLSVRGTEEAVVLMAGRTTKARRPTPKRTVAPDLSALAGRMSDAFDTRVRVELGRQKGRVIIEFASVDDLDRIVNIMVPVVTEQGRHNESGTAV